MTVLAGCAVGRRCSFWKPDSLGTQLEILLLGTMIACLAVPPPLSKPSSDPGGATQPAIGEPVPPETPRSHHSAPLPTRLRNFPHAHSQAGAREMPDANDISLESIGREVDALIRELLEISNSCFSGTTQL